MGSLQELVNTIDNRQRKYNLIFEGIAETEKEVAKETVKKLIDDANIGIDTSGIDSAYRLGKKSRPLMATFSNLTTKDQILMKVNDLKKQSNLPGLWINKDLR